MKRLTCLVLVASALTLVPPTRGTLVRGTRISITTRPTTFRLVSSVGSDRGSALRLPGTEVLCGCRGCLRLRLYGRSFGTWNVASGTGAYTNWRAQGEFSGGSYEGLLVEAE